MSGWVCERVSGWVGEWMTNTPFAVFVALGGAHTEWFVNFLVTIH